VEAARAWEAGAGFALVADEVKTLAQRSAEATNDTAGLIEDTLKKDQREFRASKQNERDIWRGDVQK
jgi:methyl-accepting chemotaxis protein